MRKRFYGTIIMVSCLLSTLANADESRNAQEDVFGHVLAVIPAMKGSYGLDIVFDGKKIGNIDDGVDAEFKGKYAVKGATIVVIEYFSGNGCAVQYDAVILSPQPNVTKTFGTCNDPVSISSNQTDVKVKSPIPGNQMNQFMQAIPSKTHFEIDTISKDGLKSVDVYTGP